MSNSTSNILSEIEICAIASNLTTDRIKDIDSFAKNRNQKLIPTLIEREKIDEHSFFQNVSNLLGFKYTPDQDTQAQPEAILAIEPTIATSYQIMPIEFVDDTLHIACSTPFDWQTWDELEHILCRKIQKVLCTQQTLDRLLKSSYGIGAETIDRLLASKNDTSNELKTHITTDLSDEDAANEPTVVNFINQIILEAISNDATDIHFEPYDSKYRIRYRIDGSLENIPVPTSINTLKQALVSRIKIMANLDITEKRLPQDGRAQVTLRGIEFDLRISILPGIFGEAANIRIQRRQMVKLDLLSLGFHEDEQQKINNLISRPHGLILVTGPTGSGKTTTLYTCLSQINTPDTKIITVEDPVEYWMEDILQLQVQDNIGFSFASALRSILRHDPDVMLVGEIRDAVSADIAIRSSLTGHLVFASLHTNDAAGAVSRLIDIGIEPFLAASSISGIIAQRLVRNICKHCKIPVPKDSFNDLELSLLSSVGITDPTTLLVGKGCDQCRYTGYSGRSAISEVLPITEKLRQLIQERANADTLQKLAVSEGMRTLQQSALLAVKAGKTTITEVLRVTQD